MATEGGVGLAPGVGRPAGGDVQFDHVAALAAADLCDRIAAQVLDVHGRRDALAESARKDWEGPNRRHFDERLAVIRHRSRALHAGLLTTASQLRTASYLARVDQARREADRLRDAPPVLGRESTA